MCRETYILYRHELEIEGEMKLSDCCNADYEIKQSFTVLVPLKEIA